MARGLLGVKYLFAIPIGTLAMPYLSEQGIRSLSASFFVENDSDILPIAITRMVQWVTTCFLMERLYQRYPVRFSLKGAE